jgi:hypothetical protein
MYYKKHKKKGYTMKDFDIKTSSYGKTNSKDKNISIVIIKNINEDYEVNSIII